MFIRRGFFELESGVKVVEPHYHDEFVESLADLRHLMDSR